MKAVKFSILSCEKLCSLLSLITFTLIILKDRAKVGVIWTFSKSFPAHLVLILILFALVIWHTFLFSIAKKKKNCQWLGYKLSTLLYKDNLALTPPSAPCVACLRITPQVMETHKSRAEKTLKYLNLAKINKLRYSLHFLWAVHRILSS